MRSCRSAPTGPGPAWLSRTGLRLARLRRADPRPRCFSPVGLLQTCLRARAGTIARAPVGRADAAPPPRQGARPAVSPAVLDRRSALLRSEERRVGKGI